VVLKRLERLRAVLMLKFFISSPFSDTATHCNTLQHTAAYSIKLDEHVEVER